MMVTWHKIDERRPSGVTDREWVQQLEDAVGHLLETIDNLGGEQVNRFWPEFEGWAATLSEDGYPEHGCPCPNEGRDCYCCDPPSISAIAADWIDPHGEKPEGWRMVDIDPSEERCGAWDMAHDGGCILPKGHNQGKPDIPANHQFPPTRNDPKAGEA